MAHRSPRITPVKGRREGGGGQNWGAHDDTRPSSTGIVGRRNRPGDGQGCEDHPPIHRPWPGAAALGVEAVKAGRSVYFSTLADIIASLAKAEREGCLRERIRWLARAACSSST